MLREIRSVRQDKPGFKRRWYQDEFFDLYTWHAQDGAMFSFQLCYDVNGRERALTWHRQRGFSHNRIDSGATSSKHPGSPLMAAGGPFPHRMVRTRFIQHGAALDAATHRFIQDKMREYGRSVARGPIPMPRRRPRSVAAPPPD